MVKKIWLRKRLAALFMAFAVTLSCLIGVVPVGVTVEAAYDHWPIRNDDYPLKNGAIGATDNWGFASRWCTSFVAWRINDRHGIPFRNDGFTCPDGQSPVWGDAKNWGYVARNHGIRVDTTPAAGSVLWSTDTTYSSYGHVAWVNEVKPNGDIVTEEYNYDNGSDVRCSNQYHSITLTPKYGSAGNGTGCQVEGYIHFEDLANPSQPKEYGTPMTVGAGRTIPDGDYYIACWDIRKKDYIMTVAGTYSGSDYKGCNGENVQLYSSLGDPVQVFHIEYVDNDGFYKITNSYSGNRSLDVRDGWGYGIGAPLQIMPYVKNNPAQLWSIERVDNGDGSSGYGMEGITYRIRSKCNGYYIDLPGGEVGNDKHLQLWKKDETVNKVNEQAQNWRLIPYVKPTYKPLKSGPYKIGNFYEGKYLNANPELNAAVTVGNNSNNKFFLRYTNDGCYRIESMTRDYCVDVPNNTFENSTKLQMFTVNNPVSDNQKWIIRLDPAYGGGGYYNIISQLNGLYLDKSGNNAMIHYQDSRRAQEWRIERLSIAESVKWEKHSSYDWGTVTYGQTLENAEIFKSTVEYYNYDTESYEVIPGTFVWNDSTIKPTVADSEFTFFYASFIPDDKEKFGEVKADSVWQLVKVLPAEAPEGMPGSEMNPSHKIKKIGDIELSENWKWDEADADTVLEDGKPVIATAVYTGADGGAGNYKTESVTVTVTRQSCSHPENKQEVRGKTEPDCTNKGYTGDTYCTECDTVIESGSPVAALGHKYGSWSMTKAPGCTEKGTLEKNCTVCGDTVTEEIAETGHSYDGTFKHDENDHWQECTECHGKKDVTGHIWNDGDTVSGDCTNGGTVTYSCEICGRTKTESIPASGHELVRTEAKQAACLEKGNIEYWSCKNCKKLFGDKNGTNEISEDDIVIAALGHNYGSWTITKEPSKNTVGSAERICMNDRTHKDTVVLPVLTDTSVWTEGTTVPATEEQNGSQEYTSVYGNVTVMLPALGHTEHTFSGDWLHNGNSHWKKCDKCDEITVPENHFGGTASCKEKAVCEVCGQSYGNNIPHTEVIDPAVAATCTSEGLSAGRHCSVCGEILTPQTVIPMTAHKEDSGTVTTKPTVETEGVRTFKCVYCGMTMRTETISAIPEDHTHNYGSIWKYDGTAHWYECECGDITDYEAHEILIRESVPASCTESGKTEGKYCSVCGLVILEQSLVPAAGHTIVNDEAVEATCTEAGKTEGTHCSVCGEVIVPQTTIPATGHIGGTASCSEKAVCAVCGQTYGELLPHTEDSGTVIKHPTETETGTKIFKCAVCGAELRRETIPAAGVEHTHFYGDEWKYSTNSHWHECECGEKSDFADHISDNGVITKQPTSTETGIKAYSCTVCSAVIKTETIPAFGTNHEPSRPSEPSYPSQPTTPPTNNEPYIKGDKGQTGWETISDKIAETSDGGTVRVNMNGTTEIPKNIISEIAGRDIDLVVELDDLIWTINGKDVIKAKKVDMGVRKNTNKIPKGIIEKFFDNAKAVTLSLAHNGDFGFTATLTIELGIENNGFSANLFCYKPGSGSFEYGDSSEIKEGKAELAFTHASEWIIAIGEAPVYEDVSSAAGIYEDSDKIIIDRKCTESIIITIIILAASGFIFRRRITKYDVVQ